jgi:DNA-binding transcriptional LysR family regulator
MPAGGERAIRYGGAARTTPPAARQRCDGVSSLILAVEAGHGIALVISALKSVSGDRLLYRPLSGTTEMESVGIARATKGDVTPAGEKFCEILRIASSEVTGLKPEAQRFATRGAAH